MAPTDQRAVPKWLIAVAVLLLAARIAVWAMDRQDGGAAQVQWVPLEEAQLAAMRSGRPILYDFTADWCAPCHQLDAAVFRNPQIAGEINRRFVPVRVVDRRREEGRNAPQVDALQRLYGVRGFPTVVFAAASGEVRTRLEGFGGAEQFVTTMENVR